ncbi:ankyrin repeat-containing domain protein, partial [Annulohypoxylon nitens]
LNNNHPFDLNSNYTWETNAHNVVFALASFYNVKGCLKSLLNSAQRPDINVLLNCKILSLIPDRYTPLMLACAAGHESIVKFLLKTKADPNIKSGKTSQTALHLAASIGKRTICKYLVRRRVKVNALNTVAHALTGHTTTGHPIILLNKVLKT